MQRNEPNYKDILGFQAEVEKEIVYILKAWEDCNNSKVILFIDDLDRADISDMVKILDGLRIGYHREYNDRPDDTQCRIGPYSFDCVIPKEMGPDILIECQGDYWHNLPENKTRDARKAAYVFKNYKDSYALEYIWEHEFKDASAVKTRLHELVDGEVYVDYGAIGCFNFYNRSGP